MSAALEVMKLIYGIDFSIGTAYYANDFIDFMTVFTCDPVNTFCCLICIYVVIRMDQ